MPVIIATASNDKEPEPAGKPGVAVVRVADVARTGAQVGILLNAIGASSQLLRSDAEVGTTVDIHPDAREEAAKTYALAHLRLRDLIDETTRWGAEDDSAEVFRALHHAQLRAVEAEAALSKEREATRVELRRPSRLLGAQLGAFPTSETTVVWLAYLGRYPTSNGLVGQGDTPEKALADFDLKYTQTAAQQFPSDKSDAPPEEGQIFPTQEEPQTVTTRKRHVRKNTKRPRTS